MRGSTVAPSPLAGSQPARLAPSAVLHLALARALGAALTAYARHDERAAIYAVAEGAALLPRLHACLDPESGELAQRLAALYRYLHLELEQVARGGDPALLERLVSVAVALCPADDGGDGRRVAALGESCRHDAAKVSGSGADSR